MSQLNNPMDILKVLEKSNCGECGENTCLAFAAAVARGQRTLDQCPRIDDDIKGRFEGEPSAPEERDLEREEALDRLRRRLEGIDFESAAQRLDGHANNDRLTIKVLGKDFSVDKKGNFSSEIHIHSWLTLPVLSYIVEGRGIDPLGNWLPLRELKGGKDWGRFFEHRCEKPMKKLADTYTDFFKDMLELFAGRQVEKHYESDISLVLHPLPKLPILICYWRPDEGLGSDLHVFFDSTAEENLSIESIYTLTAGLVLMFEKIAQTHS